MRASRKPILSSSASGTSETSVSVVSETPMQCPVDGGTELRLGVDANDDAVLHEGDVRRFGVDVAGRRGITTDVIASLGPVEELGPEGAFERLGRDPDLDRGGWARGRQQKRNEEQQTKGEPVHDA